MNGANDDRLPAVLDLEPGEAEALRELEQQLRQLATFAVPPVDRASPISFSERAQRLDTRIGELDGLVRAAEPWLAELRVSLAQIGPIDPVTGDPDPDWIHREAFMRFASRARWAAGQARLRRLAHPTEAATHVLNGLRGEPAAALRLLGSPPAQPEHHQADTPTRHQLELRWILAALIVDQLEGSKTTRGIARTLDLPLPVLGDRTILEILDRAAPHELAALARWATDPDDGSHEQTPFLEPVDPGPDGLA